MGLIRRGRIIVWKCDECGDDLDTGTHDFDDAREELQREGWKTVKDEDSGGWYHYCPECR